MPRYAPHLMVLASLLAPAAAPAQETYEIKLRAPAEGQNDSVERKVDLIASIKEPDANKPKVEKWTGHFSYRETTVETKGGEAIRLKRQFRKAAVEEYGRTRTLDSVEGKTLLMEKRDRRYRLIDGKGELDSDKDHGPYVTPGDKRYLQWLLLPGKAVRVGQDWKIDTAALAKAMDAEGEFAVFDPTKSQGTGRLVRAYKKDGRQFGVIEVSVEGTLAAAFLSERRLEVRPGSKAKLTIAADICIDGTSTNGQTRIVIASDVRIGDEDRQAAVSLRLDTTTNRTQE